jgi:hypothetical protein
MTSRFAGGKRLPDRSPLQVHGERIVVFALVTSSLLARLIEVPQIRRRLVLFRGH